MEGKWRCWLLWLMWSTTVGANLPTFDEDSRMRILLLPFSVLSGSTIYRLRASDPDFGHPLEFSFKSKCHFIFRLPTNQNVYALNSNRFTIPYVECCASAIIKTWSI